ncbi:MAG: DUF1651 domain-containing protein [Kofleriaceae bacterium]|nr:DUF1651 domain-containing protein [Kofleriaceae bacterium]
MLFSVLEKVSPRTYPYPPHSWRCRSRQRYPWAICHRRRVSESPALVCWQGFFRRQWRRVEPPTFRVPGQQHCSLPILRW